MKDIISLCNAGFTAEQIGKMVAAEKNAGNPAPAPTSPEPAPANPEPAPAPDTNALLLAEMQKLTAAVQAGNLAGAKQPPEKSIDEQADEILFDMFKE